MKKARVVAIGRLAGEFAVILMGVLVALAADRWNEDRLERELGADYHHSLVVELAADSIRLDEHARDGVDRVAAGVALRHIVGGTAPDSTARALYLRCAGEGPPHPGGATFDEIRSTGALRLLSEGVPQLLFDYYGLVDGTLERITNVRGVERRAMTEAANRSGAQMPREDVSLVDFTERLRAYPGIEGIVMGCVAFQASESGLIRNVWLPHLTMVLASLRNTEADW